MLFGCEVHMIGASHERVFGGLMDNVVSGVIHFALAVNGHGAFDKLCTVFRRVVKRKVRVYRGPPPARSPVPYPAPCTHAPAQNPALAAPRRSFGAMIGRPCYPAR